jgi:hypothetical protein
MTERLTLEQLRALQAQPRPRGGNKFHARKCTVDGHEFDSRREARRYQALRLLEQAGEIRDLELQPPFVIHSVAGGAVCTYIADFRYLDVRTGHMVVEDVKGVRTPVYRLKRKFVQAEYGISVREV